jgi:orotidine-5'-phosphate decarboxylase
LDVDPRRLPAGLEPDEKGIRTFIEGIVGATADLVCAYKPNLAFFEAMGPIGYGAIEAALASIPKGIITIADGKRGDIGTTAERYAAAMFETFGFDAATINPYQGADSIEPYIADPERGAFLLCKTSNPGSADFQDLLCEDGGERRPLYEVVARRAVEWNDRGNIGLVVGATYPEQLGEVRALAAELPILIPGVGTQGGDAVEAIRLGAAANGRLAVVNVSRQVLYASSGPDWQEAARREAQALRDVMRGAAAHARRQ